MSAAASLCFSMLIMAPILQLRCVDSLPQIAEYARGHSPNFAVVERNRVDAGDQPVPFCVFTLIIFRFHQEGEWHLEGVVNLVAVDAKRKTFAHTRKGGQDAIATRSYMDIKIADRLNEAAVERDLFLGLAERG